MPWTDKFQDINVLNWTGIGLIGLNFVMLPFILFSGGNTTYDDGNYPGIELYLGEFTPKIHEPLKSTQKHTESNEHSEHEKVADTHTKNTAKHMARTTDHNRSSAHHEPATHDKINEEHSKMADTPLQKPTTNQHKNPFGIVCYQVGPLLTIDEQTKLQNLIEIKGMFASIKFSKSNENIGYWVFIPPLRSRSLGRLKVEELKLKGFTDVVLLSRNDPLNAISMGVFTGQKNAYQHMLKAQSLGFDAKMDVRYQSLGEMWLSVEVIQQKDLSNEGWGDLIKDYPNVQVHSIKCS